ncbi:uncharacterized protein LAESUDRAFT_334246 [Laetiporus sulphureus 93-53]|uniref:Histone H1 n=1 Tax=Laetiporus sulphureus 93-53 TaxID=1314785 RepID=A0A165CVD6_9APHY|nr:uncharacterized protein LAESUDRAFT_334246 [Laetiporus sulphureus 93-53]KZT03497.1 hypothetical protein LAESUDRAFT_334246 [Laetiporus sulphureus 93-53]
MKPAKPAAEPAKKGSKTAVPKGATSKAAKTKAPSKVAAAAKPAKKTSSAKAAAKKPAAKAAVAKAAASKSAKPASKYVSLPMIPRSASVISCQTPGVLCKSISKSVLSCRALCYVSLYLLI